MTVDNIEVGDWVKYTAHGDKHPIGEVTRVSIDLPSNFTHYLVGEWPVWPRQIEEVRKRVKAVTAWTASNM